MTRQSHQQRVPIHVVYGGAHLFKHSTPQKLGSIALKAFETYASTPAELAKAMGFKGNADSQAQVYERTRRKLETEPIEDFRIDFEDGYGVRPDEEEDAHAESASVELARSIKEKTNTAFTGFRIKSFANDTLERATRTLRIFLEHLLKASENRIPDNFTITLPKVSDASEVTGLVAELSKIESDNGLAAGSISLELMIETPAAVFDDDGKIALIQIIEAASGRCTSAHFGAYDYTSALGISAKHQSLRHPACEFARSIMLATLVPRGIRVVDSVTTEIPAEPNRDQNLTDSQLRENYDVVHQAWRTHFDNVLYSMSNGFYQSWDLHPNQLVARFAAVNFFYLDAFDEQAKRLKNFVATSQQATLTGTAFDDAASARGVVNFFLRGLNSGALTEDEVSRAVGFDRLQLSQLFRNKS